MIYDFIEISSNSDSDLDLSDMCDSSEPEESDFDLVDLETKNIFTDHIKDLETYMYGLEVIITNINKLHGHKDKNKLHRLIVYKQVINKLENTIELIKGMYPILSKCSDMSYLCYRFDYISEQYSIFKENNEKKKNKTS